METSFTIWRLPTLLVGCTLAAAIANVALLDSAVADDWSQWRGPNRDGMSRETGLLNRWPSEGPSLAWTASGMGDGYSSVAVSGGHIYTLGDLSDGCYLIALSESDGEIAWKTKIGEPGGHKKYTGPRSTPTVDGNQIFVLNQHSDLVCLDRRSGDIVWRRNLIDDFGGVMMSGWKYSESPLVDDDQVICTPGGKGGTLLALNKKTGVVRWQTGDWTDSAGYSSVVIATIHGVRQYIQLTGESVAGIDPDSGDVLWKADREGKTAVIPTPVVEADVVFVTSSYGIGCNAFRIDKSGSVWSTEEIYANKNIANHHGGVVLLDGHVFGSSGGTFRCLKLANGELVYNERSAGKGATVYADGHFYLRAEGGAVALIEATTDGLTETGRFEQPSRSNTRAWAHPVVANGKMYLRDQDLLLCYDVRKK